jgi:hypothetical protein
LKANINRTLIKEQLWFPLDNAAKIYPAVRTGEHTTVFRISIILKDVIRIGYLMKALSLIEKRFPYFMVRLRKGMFWYYLEYINQTLIPEADVHMPCRAFNDHSKNNLLFRVLVKNNRISVEFSHILTDGTGAFQFLLVLVETYFQETGIPIRGGLDIQPGLPAHAEEYEDAYNRYFREDTPPVLKYPKAFHLPFLLAEKPRFHILTAKVDLIDIKTRAAGKKVSITEYLTAVYLVVLQEIYNDLSLRGPIRRSKILRVQVPVNLRRIYPTKTMRNFSLFVLPEIDLRLGHYSFDEIVEIVHHKMQLETDKKLINKIISRNVGSERNIVVRGIPLFFKSLILHHKFYSAGANQYSGVITNFGKVDLPSELADKTESFNFIPPPPNKKLKVNCGIIGFRDHLVISFGNISRSNELEKKFFRFLTGQNIKVKITN